MNKSLMAGVLAAAVLIGCTLAKPGLLLTDVPLIAKDELRNILDSPGVMVLDVRTDQDWYEATQKIRGAVHHRPQDYAEWMPKYPKDRRYVLYCA